MSNLKDDIEEYLLWLNVHNYAHSTITNRRRYLDYFSDFMTNAAETETAAVTLELLQEYQRYLFTRRKADGQRLTFGTQGQRLVAIQHFFSWLRRSGRIAVNPAADLTLPRPDRRLPEATLSANDMSAVLACPDVATPLGLRDRAVLEVFYSCALRRGELIALSTRDVDFERGTIFIRHGKGGKDRYVPIGERALFWLRIYLDFSRPRLAKGITSERLFISSVGTPLCPDWLSRKVRAYFAAAQVEKRGSCHLLRHTVATLMLEGGADIRYVAEMLGHARLETTQRYTRVSIERLRAVHAASHPAAGLNVAFAKEIQAILPVDAGPALKRLERSQTGRASQ